jgi:arylsulfatase A-like enzyme
MDRRKFIKGLGVGFIGLTGGCKNFLASSSSANMLENDIRPNVVIIHTDDQNFDALGCYGADVYTPNMDNLASSGVLFRRGYATCSICTPSRYSLLTGRFPGRNLQKEIPEGKMLQPTWEGLRPGEVNLASIMKKSGYFTGIVGKTLRETHPDRNEWPKGNAWLDLEGDFDPQNEHHNKLLKDWQARMIEINKADGWDIADRLSGNPESLRQRSLNLHNLEWQVEGALEFLDKAKGKQFALYFATTLHHIPHPQQSLLLEDPLVSFNGYLEKMPEAGMPSRKEIFDEVLERGYEPQTAYCTWLDYGVGSILKKLREMGIEKNTIVILASDHSTHGKNSLYESGVRTPTIVSYPGKIKGGQVCDELVQNIDFLPTILAACGVENPAGNLIDGKNLLPLLRQETETVHESLYFELGCSRAVVTKNFKYLALRYPDDGSKIPKYHSFGMEPHQHQTLLKHPNYWDSDQLYDLRTDPQETTNLANQPQYKDKLQEMKNILRMYLVTFGNHPFGELL